LLVVLSVVTACLCAIAPNFTQSAINPSGGSADWENNGNFGFATFDWSVVFM